MAVGVAEADAAAGVVPVAPAPRSGRRALGTEPGGIGGIGEALALTAETGGEGEDAVAGVAPLGAALAGAESTLSAWTAAVGGLFSLDVRTP